MDREFIASELVKIAKDLTRTASRYKILHDRFYKAVDEARSVAEKKGFEIDEDDWFSSLSTGPRKPGAGKTNRYKIHLTKDGKPVRKMLIFQVYGMEKTFGEHSGNYELNAYIS